MKIVITCALLTLGAAMATGPVSALPESPTDLRDDARLAVDGEAGEREAATARLRKAGPNGMSVLRSVHRVALDELKAAIARDPGYDTTVRDRHLMAALDAVSAQRNGWASELYWFTDLEAALERARETSRPVISLRLLGRLDEEFS